MPDPKKYKTRDDFLEVCVPTVMKEGTVKDNTQAVAVCSQMWKDKDNKKEQKTELKLETVDIDKPIHIAKAGIWNGHEVSEDNIDEAIDHFKNKVADPYITLDHDPIVTEETKRFFKTMSLGKIKEMWREGKDWFCRLKKVPKLIAELIDAGSISQRSIEFWKKNFKHGNGKLYNNVLEALTFHGANGLPAISTLNDIPKLFKAESDINEYKISFKSIEQPEDCIKISYKSNFKKEEKNMEKVEISKAEYEELITLKNNSTKIKDENEVAQEEAIKLKTENEKLKEDIDNMKKDSEELVTLKKKIEVDEKDRDNKEGTGFVDGLISDEKLLPKYRDSKIKEYLRFKTEKDEEGLKLFKEELENRGKIVNFQNILKNEDNAPTDDISRIDFKTGDGLDEACQARAKKLNITWEKAHEQIMQEHENKMTTI